MDERIDNIITAVYDLGDGTRVAEGIDPNGEAVFAVLGDPNGEDGCACAQHARHEQIGKLPADILARIHTGGARR
ncbi:hypothetical protein [Microbacterium rhizosphaerae]|uniref:Uncharacterized protein n=1 Tax=Microbacterium rhizosphaerae TaxID=1678237 RepID=A0ABZ0SHI4_9MICO|nr:hypothetical protein [Microbacterium rhizosphaerae]WPR88388.1 hypothetical protein SM116_11425 [Microbacterium rhizosphaerae]